MRAELHLPYLPLYYLVTRIKLGIGSNKFTYVCNMYYSGPGVYDTVSDAEGLVVRKIDKISALIEFTF